MDNGNTNPYIFFQAGVTAVLRSWSALRTAVEQSWGGPSSHSKAEDLRSNIFHYYDGKATKLKMDAYELEENLLSYMEDEFGVVLEDGSEREIANLICSMYEACIGRGDVTLAQSVVHNSMRAEEGMKSSNIKNVFQDGQEDLEEDDKEEEDDDCDDDDDDIMDEEQEDGDVMVVETRIGHTLQSMDTVNFSSELAFATEPLFSGPPSKPMKELPPPRQLGEPEPEKPQPVLDEDGFAMVPIKGKAGSKKGN